MIALTDGITLLRGQTFNYLEPETCVDIDINDIAVPLANICRYAGQLPFGNWYSVAQHAWNVSQLVPTLTALMHDTSEAFTNDITTPLKAAVPLFKEIELKIESDMARRFNFQFPLPPEVKLADLQMLALEMTTLRGMKASSWEVLQGVEFEHLRDKVDLTSWPPMEAYTMFIARYEELSQ